MWDTAVTNGLGFLAKRQKAKASAAWDKYNNAMTGIQTAQGNNALSTNVALNRAAHAKNNILIQRSRLMAVAKVNAGASAAGVGGGSVQSTVFDLGRSAGEKIAAENSRFETSLLVSDQRRRGLSMQRELSMKPITQTPSFLTALATTGLSILNEDTTKPSSEGTSLEGPNNTDDLGGWDKLKSMLMI